ncbi:hypothetical protein N7501_005916 [Penicillium viridicatum]|nr:hypothetical protein N7501_005916 [Penicillium viridicatum]
MPNRPTPEDGEAVWSKDDLVVGNKTLLVNFLEGLELNNTVPKRVILQLGAKYYGLHRSPTGCPQVESDPRILSGPKFYYHQDDYLQAFAKKHQIGYNATRPSHIAGAVLDAAMNLLYLLGIYAMAWDANVSISSARANGYLAECIVLTDQGTKESFNASYDSLFTYHKGQVLAEAC